ncbi:hypothetical protein HYT24_02235 [Candidatus Pacearchaeota archaeon]|nr:hypothetical protein [Candidatus Pacearchaeota archaeon]
MKAVTLLKIEGFVRPITVRILHPKKVVSVYSENRLAFLKKLHEDLPSKMYFPPKKFRRRLWGLEFRSPIMNSAGMFKNGEGYEITSRQGAGAYLGGTGTFNNRKGNEKEGIFLPFAPYPSSGAASNWLGLPNDGDLANSETVKYFRRIEGMPIGWSVMGSPDYQGEEKLRHLIESMKLYEKAGVDFLEINESCPNTSHGKPQDDDLANRLKYIKKNFLSLRQRKLPIIVKFSNDTELEQVHPLLDMLFEFGFDGVNFGNTSTLYDKRKEKIHKNDKRVYDYFTKTFGGGVSGRPLKESSFMLASKAVKYLRIKPPKQEFHVIRTGGIENINDITASEKAGISLNQWFTGYFDNLAKNGHKVYENMFES